MVGCAEWRGTKIQKIHPNDTLFSANGLSSSESKSILEHLKKLELGEVYISRIHHVAPEIVEIYTGKLEPPLGGHGKISSFQSTSSGWQHDPSSDAFWQG